jgi:hypothetical protein
VKTFEATYGAKFGKAVAKITDDLEVLLAVYDFPAGHWQHLRTTNPIVIFSSKIDQWLELGFCVGDGIRDGGCSARSDDLRSSRPLGRVAPGPVGSVGAVVAEGFGEAAA